jgi:hypothetical protein
LAAEVHHVVPEASRNRARLHHEHLHAEMAYL